MLSYFTTATNKAQDARAQVQCYNDRRKDFIEKFTAALPKLAMTKILDDARHTGEFQTNISIVKLAEEFHALHTGLYGNYIITITESDHKEMMKILMNYLSSETFEVCEKVSEKNSKVGDKGKVEYLHVEWRPSA